MNVNMGTSLFGAFMTGATWGAISAPDHASFRVVFGQSIIHASMAGLLWLSVVCLVAECLENRKGSAK